MLPDAALAQAARVLAAARESGLRIATAESCTGGLVAAALTYAAGASDVFERGFVTYSNEAKSALLGVPAALIAAEGAVSEAVARAMAAGAIAASAADIAVSITGIAGPGGGTAAKPVGLVWFGVALRGGEVSAAHVVFPGDRAAVRAAATAHALSLLALSLSGRWQRSAGARH